MGNAVLLEYIIMGDAVLLEYIRLTAMLGVATPWSGNPKPFCLFFVRMRDLSSPIVFNTSSFVLCSVQLTFSILLQIHISKASSLLRSSFGICCNHTPYTPY